MLLVSLFFILFIFICIIKDDGLVLFETNKGSISGNLIVQSFEQGNFVYPAIALSYFQREKRNMTLQEEQLTFKLAEIQELFLSHIFIANCSSLKLI